MHSRTNNNIVFSMQKEKKLKIDAQKYILEWFSEHLKLPQKRIKKLQENEKLREEFFHRNNEFFDTVIYSIMNNPILSKKTTDFLFEKEKKRLAEEEAKK